MKRRAFIRLGAMSGSVLAVSPLTALAPDELSADLVIAGGSPGHYSLKNLIYQL
jgi:hypothetical protein